jgi:transcriptional regulator of the spore photoproduct lyase operon
MYQKRKVMLMELDNNIQTYQAGDIVYVFYRNPHTQDVANIQAAAVVNNPEKENELALFLYETYYPLSNQIAVYSTEKEANQAYNYYYGDASEGSWNE